MQQRFIGKNVLVTGGAGFIGSHLTDHLIQEGASVVVLDNLATGQRENLRDAEATGKCVFVQGDANQYDVLTEIFHDHPIDYVFQYAAVVGVKNVIERPLEVFHDIDGMKHLLALAREHGVKKVVFASSSEAYGEPLTLPEREDGSLNVSASDPYGLTKLVGENMITNYWKQHGLAGTSLRFFNVYGPRQNASAYGFVVGIFIERLLRGESLTIFGDGKATRDFVYIDDNVEVAMRAALSDAANGEVINVGSGAEMTVTDLAKTVGEAVGVTPVLTYEPPRAMEVRYRRPDTTKLERVLGFVPATPLVDGLKKTVDWYRSRATKATS